MKDKSFLIESYISNRSDVVEEDFFASSNLEDIEDAICHLRTLSSDEHRIFARKIYSKLRDRISEVNDHEEKKELIRIARIINMKVKSV